MNPPPKERNIITDKVVLPQTGQSIESWFEYLDHLGAKDKTHLEIFNLISETQGLQALGQWNHNLLATSYEWSRGLKERGQKGKEFEISVSKTIEVPVSAIYRAWTDESARLQWLGEQITIRKSTVDKSARITWSDGTTSLSVDFYAKGDHKSQVVVQHLKISEIEQANSLKAYWGEKLNSLKSFLER